MSASHSYTDAQLAFELEDFIGGRITCDDGMNYTTMEIPGHKWQRIIAALKRSALNPQAAWPFPKRLDGPNERWISVKDRLPEIKAAPYLVWVADPDFGWAMTAIYEPKTKRKINWTWYCEPAGINPIVAGVTHWRELPPCPPPATGTPQEKS